MHPNNVRSSCPTTLIFTTCTLPHLPLLTPTPSCKKKIHVSAPHRNYLPTIPSHAFPSQKPTPPVAHGCHVSREIMGASEHFSREKDNLAQGLGKGSGPASWLAKKKAFAALAPGSWSWVASGIAQFWNLMQERSHGALTFDFF